MGKLLSLSVSPDINYLASIEQITNVSPIPGADNIKKTTIRGRDVIISNDVQIGDIVVYFPVETQISEQYLSANNLYNISNFTLNENSENVSDVLKNIAPGEISTRGYHIYGTAKDLCGFFEANGRVRILKLRNTYSQGFVAGVETLMKAYPDLLEVRNHFRPDHLIGTQFDTVCGERICKKYVPKSPESIESPQQRSERSKRKTTKKYAEKLNSTDRIIPGTFQFHYDTVFLADHMDDIDPNDTISITVKMDGTSGAFANIPIYRKLSLKERIKKRLKMDVQLTEYCDVYSSRRVIRNKKINPDADLGYYKIDIWDIVNDVISKYIPKDTIVYGEIIGYLPGSDLMFQEDYDYYCAESQWKFMPYRIVTNTASGQFEWNVGEVYDWIKQLIKDHPELEEHIYPIQILYHGLARNLYPDLDLEHHWHENFFASLKTDSKFFMEKKEPLCKNDVPREGLVIRKDNDTVPRAWKVKTTAHYEKEAERHDAGKPDAEEVS